MTVFYSVMPVVSIILLGFFIARSGLIAESQWDGVENLAFKILIPAIIIHSIYSSDLSLSRAGVYVWMLLLAVGGVGVTVFVLKMLLPSRLLPHPDFTTLFQATTRWNAFIALGAGAQAIGDLAPGLIAVAMAFIIPAINVANIVVLSVYAGKKLRIIDIVLVVAKNPIVIACVVGLLINLAGVTLNDQIRIPLEMVSRSALAVGLLAIGAGLDLSRMFSPSWVLMLGVAVRIILCPLLFFVMATAAGLDSVQLACGLLICGVPAASNGYILAKKMGGNAELFADMVTWQTVLSPITITIGLSTVL